MKKILVSLMLISVCTISFAQTEDYKRPSYFGVSFFVNDYTTAQRIRTTSFANVINNKQQAKFNQMAPGMALNFFKGMSRYVDMAATLGGSFPNVPQQDGSTTTGDRFLLEGDVTGNFKMFDERYVFTPYLIGGIGLSSYSRKIDAFLPLGGGFKLNIFDEAAVFLTAQYRVPVTMNTNNYHFNYSIGVSSRIGKPRETVVREVP